MGGGVSSLPAEVSLAEAKEAGGRQVAARVGGEIRGRRGQDLQGRGGEVLEGVRRPRPRSPRSVVKSWITAPAATAPGTWRKRWTFRPYCRETRAAPARHARMGLRGGHALAHRPEARLFWLVGGGGTGKSVAAAELLARLLDKQNASRGTSASTHEPARSAPAVLLRSLAGMLCATVEGLRGRAEGERGRRDGQGRRELFEALSQSRCKTSRRTAARTTLSY